MPCLKIHKLPEEDVYKDMVRIPEKYRLAEDGDKVEESTVCLIRGTPKTSLAVLRGCLEHPDREEIHMDDRTRDRLGVKEGESYEFKFKVAGCYDQLKWAWYASETGYRVASRLGIFGLILGVIGLFLGMLPVLCDLVGWLSKHS